MSEVDFFDGMIVVVKFFQVLHILLENGHVSCQVTANIEDIVGLFKSIKGGFGGRGENRLGTDLSQLFDLVLDPSKVDVVQSILL